MRYTTKDRLPVVYDPEFMQWLEDKYPGRNFRNNRVAYTKFNVDCVSTRDIGKYLKCTTANVFYLLRDFKSIIDEYLEEKNA